MDSEHMFFKVYKSRHNQGVCATRDIWMREGKREMLNFDRDAEQID